MATVKLDRLTKVYDDGDLAVDRVDLTIDDGEFFVVLGPSGCGKTSMLRMIAGLESISAGDITVDDRSVRDMPTRGRGLGMLFQQSALYPHMSVRENIGFPLKLQGRKRREIDERVEELASELGLARVLDARPGQLSGGMRQRVAMGRALARDPTMLLMDEPMSNLDAQLRTELRSTLAAMHRATGVTTVYVTHDQVEAMALGDRAAVMRAGRIVQCATPAELYRCPVDLFVATFIGSPPMNVLRARVEVTGDTIAAVLGHDRIELGSTSRWAGSDLLGRRDVAVGFRPESVSISAEPTGAALTVEITRAERLGAHVLASATVEAQTVVDEDGDVEVADEPFSTIGILLDEDIEVDLWRPVGLDVDLEAVHLFDLRSGRTIRTVGGVPVCHPRSGER